MTVSAIICEFNPLHTGHKKLIDYAKTISDKVICIMSGNFVQRGMPACADKYQRAKHAIMAGADMVVELPTVFATSSAENFAFGGVSIAKQLNVHYLVFGSECGDIEKLWAMVDKLEDKQINKQIKSNLSQGMNYPKAVSLAINDDLLQSPNNTLAIEYLKAIKQLNCKAVAKTIKREDNYNGDAIDFASSSALRNDPTLRNTYSFNFVIEDINDKMETQYKNFAPHALSVKTAQELSSIEGITEGLENKIVQATKCNGFDEMLSQVKSKRYTRAKLQRVILNCILNITKNDVINAKKEVLPIKVLAVKNGSLSLLQQANNKVYLISQKADKLYYSFTTLTPPNKLQKYD